MNITLNINLILDFDQATLIHTFSHSIFINVLESIITNKSITEKEISFQYQLCGIYVIHFTFNILQEGNCKEGKNNH